MATTSALRDPTQVVRDAPAGIPKTAAFLALDEDKSTLIFRRFHPLSTRNLLFLEARVAALQRLQRRLDHTDSKRPDIVATNKSWEEFAFLGSGGGKRGEMKIPSIALEQWEIARQERLGVETDLKGKKSTPNPPEQTEEQLKIDETLKMIQDRWDVDVAILEALKEYQEAILRYRDISSMVSPAQRSLETIQKWFNPPDPQYDLEGQFLRSSAMKNLFTDTIVPRGETMALHIPADDDRVSKWLSRREWYTGLAQQDMVEGFAWTPEKWVHDGVTWINLTIAIVFLVGATWALWGSEHAVHFTVRLGVLTAWVVAFAAWIGCLTNASRGEVFAATAAYAAVLVVFVGQG